MFKVFIKESAFLSWLSILFASKSQFSGIFNQATIELKSPLTLHSWNCLKISSTSAFNEELVYFEQLPAYSLTTLTNFHPPPYTSHLSFLN
jgi:hypothetical protein